MVSEKAQTSGGFRNILNLKGFFRGRLVQIGLHARKGFAASRKRRGLGAWLFLASLGGLSLAGCQDYNPYLGAASTQSSTITYLTPASQAAGCPGFTLDVHGIGFNNLSVVDWNNSPRTTDFDSSGELLATINASDFATQVPVSIVINTPQPPGQQNLGNNLSNFVSFTIAPPALPAPQGTGCPAPPTFPPTFIALQPTSGTAGTTLQIAGNYFGGTQGASTVTVGGVAATVTSWSGTLLAVTVPTVPLNGASSVTVPVVVNVNGVPAVVQTGANNSFIVLSSGSSSQMATSSAFMKTASSPSSVVGPQRFLPFVTTAADPSSAQSGVSKVFLRDTCQGAPASCSPVTIPVSVGFDGTDPNGASRSPSVSANGRFVAFASDANNLVRGDANGVTDIFVRDTCVGAAAGCVPTTTRVSTGPDGIEPNGASSTPKISLDGRFVAFNSAATNLASDVQLNNLTNSEPRFLWDSCVGAANGCKPSLTKLKFLPASR